MTTINKKLFKLRKPRLKTKPPKVIAHNKTYNRKKQKAQVKKEIE